MKSTKTKTVTKGKEQKKQVYVNLDQIWNPNPALVKIYEDAHATELFWEKDVKSEYVNEARCFNSARAGKKPIKHNIFALYRKQVGSKEYLYFLDLMVARDYFQNKIDWTRIIGKWEKPIITQKWGLNPASLKSDSMPEPGAMGDPEVEGFEEVYEFPWEQMRSQLIRWKETGIIGDKAIYYVITNRKYSVPYSWDQWLNLPIQDLELLGQHGKKFGGLIKPGDPKTLQVLKETIQQEIAKSLMNTPK